MIYLKKYKLFESSQNTDDLVYLLIRNRNVEGLKKMLDNGLDPNAELTTYTDTMFHVAARDNNNVKIIELLLKYGADINKKNYWGNTPLKIASMANHRDVIKTLLINGANPYDVDTLRNQFTLDLSVSELKWLMGKGLQKELITHNQKLYFFLKDYQLINDDIKKEFSYLDNIKDLNLL